MTPNLTKLTDKRLKAYFKSLRKEFYRAASSGLPYPVYEYENGEEIRNEYVRDLDKKLEAVKDEMNKRGHIE